MNIVAPFGFYGFGNIGDEATLQGFARVLGLERGRFRAWVASRDPRHTARAEPGLRYYRYQHGWRRYATSWIRQLANGYVFPGGTPIMDGLGDWPLNEVAGIIHHARRWRKPVVFVGAGTERLERAQSRRIVSEALADYVAHWSVRSSRDRERLLELGVSGERVTVAADMAWLIPPASADFGRRLLGIHAPTGGRLVGVNVNAEQALLAREPKLFEKLAAALDRVIEAHRFRVMFLCNEIREGETYDKAAAGMVLSHMRHNDEAFILPNEYWTPQEMMSVIASCELTISTRYHFCLFSALQGVPFLAIKRSDKVADLCEDLAWPYTAALGELSTERLVESVVTLLDGRDRAVRSLADQIAPMRLRAERNRLALDAIRASYAARKASPLIAADSA
jgi:polysaccharide pyruvyl transferase WcaK-like protein